MDDELTSSKEAEIIYNAMDERMFQLWDKLINEKYNAATMFAFRLGFISDIDKALKAMNIKRTIIEKEMVLGLEVVDIEGEVELIKGYN